MDVKATGRGAVTEITQGNGLPAQVIPRHGVGVYFQTERMDDQFQTIVQGTVVLDIGQLHAEEAGACTVEYGKGLVIIVVDDVRALHLGQAVGTVRRFLKVIVVLVTGVVLMDQGTAAFAADIVVVVTMLTQRKLFRSGIVSCPQTFSAVAAQDDFFFQTGGSTGDGRQRGYTGLRGTRWSSERKGMCLT